MMKVRLSNGAEYDATMCIPSGRSLSINVVGEYDLPEIAAAFGDPANTGTITAITDGAETSLRGFTYLTTVNRYTWNRGNIQIALTQETEE